MYLGEIATPLLAEEWCPLEIKKLNVDVDLLYQDYLQVSSALADLTAEFGMGSGVPPPLQTSTLNLLKV